MPVQSGGNVNDDEIDLRELIRSLWETRFVVALALLGFAALFWLAVMVLGASQGMVHTWKAGIQFTFTGINEGTYPNGEAFSSTDLLSPVVLGRVYADNELEAHGIDRSTFFNAVSISNVAPNREFVVQRFRRELDRDRLSLTEIREIEDEFSRALARAARGQAEISLTLREGLRPGQPTLPDALATKVLLDIPRVWSRYMTEETGMFASDLSLYSVDVLDSSMYREMDFLMAYDALKERFRLLRSNLNQLGSLRSVSTVRDPETGLRVTDIRALVGELEDFVLEDVLAPSVTARVSRNPEMVVRFFNNRVEDLERRRLLMDTRARRVEQALQDYVSSGQSSGGEMAGMGMSDELRMMSAGTTIPQFGSDFLDRLVQLGSDSGDIQFRQNLSRERLDYLLEAAELQSEANRLQQLIALISGEDIPGGLDEDERVRLVQEVSEGLDQIVSEMRGLFLAVERIADRLNELRFGGQEAIYVVVRAPERADTPPLVLTRSNLQRFVLGAFLVLILSVMGVFLFNMLRDRGGD